MTFWLRPLTFLGAVAVASAADLDLSTLPPPAAATRPVDFVKDVQPLLADRCHSCHGPEKQKSGLRLDNRERAFKGGDSGVIIVPGKSAESLMVHLISGLDKERQMPPKGGPLSAEQIGIIRAWIDRGAVWPEEASAKIVDSRKHWAFQAPARPAPPAEAGKSVNPIDAFVSAKLKTQGLAPNPEAPPETICRRLYLDLLGLPPTPEQVASFLAGHRADPIRNLQICLDSLLASPHYGERWARHWMDAARYADSDGFEKDKPRTVWPWRDYVVSSINRDLPYNQFIIEQIAGDLLPNATQDQVVATGFLRHSMTNEEGGVDPEQFRMDAMFDRMDCIGKSVMGLTIQCAQCHNHKFDPLSQNEYYQLFAFLNNDDEPQQVIYSPAEMARKETLRSKIREMNMAAKEQARDWAARTQAWEGQLKAKPGQIWEAVTGEWNADSLGGQKFLPQADQSYLCQSYAPTKHSPNYTAKTNLKRITAFRMELLNDPNLPCNGPGRSFKGTSALTEFKVTATGADGKPASVKFTAALADFGDTPNSPLEPNFDDKSKKKRITGPVEYAIDGKDDTAWGIDAGPGRRNQPRVAIFIPERPIENPSGIPLTITLTQNHGGWNSDDHMNNNLGRFRISVTGDAPPAENPLPPRVMEALAVAREQRSPAQQETIFNHWRTTVPDLAEVNQKIEALWKEWPAGSTQLVLQTREGGRPTKLLKRGDWLQPGDDVNAGVPAVLNALPEKEPRNRLTFARWLVDRKSPTAARVFVNRVWQSYFGQGLVSTPEDFGVRCEAPSHPELLDWLAVEFMEHDWSLKHLHRLICSSETYRRSAAAFTGQRDKDPSNRWLERGARFRVEGEIIRDIALGASGLLNPRMGGPSMMPKVPDYLLGPPVSYAPVSWWRAVEGRDRFRRSLYTFRRRSVPDPVMQMLDAPNGDSACVRRARSNTPLQALVTLNEEIFNECAQALARRVLTECPSDERAKIDYAFRLCVARPAKDGEAQTIREFLEMQRKRLAEDKSVAAKIAPAAPPAGCTAEDLAAWTLAARIVLNLDETMTRE